MIASPFGVFLGSEAVVDVGSLVAIGASISTTDFSNAPELKLTGPVENYGLVTAGRSVLFYGSQVANHGTIRAGTGEILMLGGDSVHFLETDVDSIVSRLLEPMEYVAILGSGRVENHGSLFAPDVGLVGRRVANYGEIEVADGTLMMLGADAVYVSEFDNPVLVRLPHDSAEDARPEGSSSDEPEYAVENHGQIRAGLGHVRLAASDPLGWGIRQGTGGDTSESQASIQAQKIEIAAGDDGRVSLSGTLDASAPEADQVGGQIDVTGDIITLVGTDIDASGGAGGGTIQIGGEQQGRGELQRARALLVDEETEIAANALVDGDGGRVILFSEELTLVGGALSARGGEEGGNGGFIETSGLEYFNITMTPDASAPKGDAGEWLIDPHTINIVLDALAPDCSGDDVCINRAIEAVLTPDFDDAAFDDIFRTVAGAGDQNDLSVDLLIRALVVGTNVTLSTQAFNPEDGDPEELGAIQNGDINVQTAITIRDDGTLQGTNATLTLRAAGDINIDSEIQVEQANSDETPDFALGLVLRANDQSQRDPNADFGFDQLAGDVNINANISTGGGGLTASGISVTQAAGTTIETGGGSVNFTSGFLGITDLSAAIERQSSDTDVIPDMTPSFKPGHPDPGRDRHLDPERQRSRWRQHRTRRAWVRGQHSTIRR